MRSNLLGSIHRLLDDMVTDSDQQRDIRAQFLTYIDEDYCSRNYTEPGHFTASGFVRTADFSQICLIFHPRFQKWIQPGGHLEKCDADIMAAAQREVAEETGLVDITWDGTIRLDIHDVPETSKQTAHRHFDIQLGFVAPFVPLKGDVRGSWIAYDSFDKSKSDDSVLRFLESWR